MQCRLARVVGNRSKSRAKVRKRVSHARLRSTIQRRGRSTKPRFASGSRTTSSAITWAAAVSAGASSV